MGERGWRRRLLRSLRAGGLRDADLAALSCVSERSDALVHEDDAAPSEHGAKPMPDSRQLRRRVARFMLTLRFSPGEGRAETLHRHLTELLSRLPTLPGVTGGHLLRTETPNAAPTAEQKIRGGDASRRLGPPRIGLRRRGACEGSGRGACGYCPRRGGRPSVASLFAVPPLVRSDVKRPSIG